MSASVQKNAFASLLASVQPEIDRRLQRLLTAEVRRAARLGPEAQAMVAALADLCSRGGKRLRPALLVAGFRSVNARAKLELAFEAGVALELLQAYFLIHDDWMDRDTLRRGGPTVHVRLTAEFEDAHLGASSAILAGDYAAAIALERMAQLGAEPARLQVALRAFAEMQSAAVLGQQLDVIGQAKNVETVYALKTTSYTVLGPLRLGALLAGGDDRVLTVLERFAKPLGLAFQLRDDVLSAFGEPRVTGKPLGNDLIAGKRTVLLLEAEQRGSSAERRALSKVVGNARAGVRDVRAAIGALESSGALTIVERRIQQLARRAEAAVGDRLTPAGAQLLRGAVEVLTARRH